MTKLMAPDALRLASPKNAGAILATLDLRLAEAARGEGVALVVG
jgi:predicted nucleic acid-binding protein